MKFVTGFDSMKRFCEIFFKYCSQYWFLFQGGDADANAAVAGALLGCKLGFPAIPQSWIEGLKYKGWLDDLVNR